MRSFTFLVCLQFLIGGVGEAQVKPRNSLRDSSVVRDAFRSATQQAKQAAVQILVNDQPVALGCVVSANGEIVTKASLAPKGKPIRAKLPNGTSIPLDRVGQDDQFDVLLLKAKSGEFAFVEVSDETPEVGRFVASLTLDGAVASVGLVSLEPNRSGLWQLGSAPEQTSAYLGISLTELKTGGLRVTRDVTPEAPAYRSGIRKGDVIVSFGGYKVNRVRDLRKVISTKKPGDSVNAKVLRDGKKKTTLIELGNRSIDQWGGGPFSERRSNFPKVLSHDIRIKPEECGGPLISSSGHVVGLNIARALRVVTYAIPGGELNRIVAELRDKANAAATRQTKPVSLKTKLNVPPPNPREAAVQKQSGVQIVQSKNIRASGIDGSLLAYGQSVPADAIRRFVDLAKRDRSRIVVLDGGAAEEPGSVRDLKARWTSIQGEAWHRVSITNAIDANDQSRFAVLKEATAIWVTDDVPASVLVNTKLATQLQALREAKVPVAVPVSLAATLSILRDASSSGLGLLPDSLISDSETNASKVAAALSKKPSLVSYRIQPDSALMVRGRYLFGFGKPVEVRFAVSREWPEKRVRFGGREVADLTALRRFANRRTGPLFPPQEPEAPIVENGTLMIVGGGGLPKGLMEQFVEAAGGDDAVIAIIPISMPASQLPKRSSMAAYFRKIGAKEVRVLKQRTPEESNSEEVLSFLRKATGIWFGGGRQWRFIDAYENTKAAELMHDVLKRGGVIGGSSAGASIQGDYMARGNPLGPRDIMADGYENGLRFLKGVAIDQHFTQRNRLPDMTSLMARYPQLLGIGIDETTAIVVKKNIAEVVGKNRVCFYDRSKPNPSDDRDYTALEAGQKYDLVARKVVEEKVGSGSDQEPV